MTLGIPFDVLAMNLPPGHVAVGRHHGIALLPDGSVRCWGSEHARYWVAPSELDGRRVVSVTAGDEHTVALLEHGTILCWGSGNYGNNAPPKGLADITAVASGDYHTVVLRRDGTVACWGYKHAIPPPEAIASLAPIVDVGASGGATFLRDRSGKTHAWGRGATRQPWPLPAGLSRRVMDPLAGGTPTPGPSHLSQTLSAWQEWSSASRSTAAEVRLFIEKWSPVLGQALGDLLDREPSARIRSIAMGKRQSVACLDDGECVAWGGESLVGHPPPGMRDVEAVAAGDLWSAARDRNGTTWIWGKGCPSLPWIPANAVELLKTKASQHLGHGLFSVQFAAWLASVDPKVRAASGDTRAIVRTHSGEPIGWGPGWTADELKELVAMGHIDEVAAGESWAAARGKDGSTKIWGKISAPPPWSPEPWLPGQPDDWIMEHVRRGRLSGSFADWLSVGLPGCRVYRADQSALVHMPSGRLIAWGGLFSPREVYRLAATPRESTQGALMAAGMTWIAMRSNDGRTEIWGSECDHLPWDREGPLSFATPDDERKLSANYWAEHFGCTNRVAPSRPGGPEGLISPAGRVLIRGGSSCCTVPEHLGAVKEIAVGDDHVVALLRDGSARCWGDWKGRRREPDLRMRLAEGIAAGPNWSAVRFGDGNTVIWGDDNACDALPWVPTNLEEILTGPMRSHLSVRFSDWLAKNRPATGIEAIRVDLAEGTAQSEAYFADGRARIWGGASRSCRSLSRMPRKLEEFIRTSANDDLLHCEFADWISKTPTEEQVIAVRTDVHALALFRDGTVCAWPNLRSTAQVPEALGTVTRIAVGTRRGRGWEREDWSAALLDDGRTVIWGNGCDELPWVPSNADELIRTSPAIGPRFVAWIDASRGPTGIRVAHHGGCWLALLPDGQLHRLEFAPRDWRKVPKGLGTLASVAVGDRHVVALSADGTVRCWGFNGQHQCDVPSDVKVVVQVAAGIRHSVALLSDGTIRCWGGKHPSVTEVPTAAKPPLSEVKCRHRITWCLDSNGDAHVWGILKDVSEIPYELPENALLRFAARYGSRLKASAFPDRIRKHPQFKAMQALWRMGRSGK